MVDRSRRRLWIVNGALVLLVLVVLAGVVAGLTSSSSSADTSLRTVPTGRGTVTQTVTASGTVASAETSTLNFAAGGTVASVRVGVGDRVTRGQTVATLDGDVARANLAAARAQVTAARQQLSDAIDARDDPPAAATTTTPGASGTGTGTSGTGTAGTGTSGSDASVDSARASLRQAEAQEITSQQSAADLTLEAPQDGTVTTVDAKVGQTVGGGGIVTSSSGSGGSSGASGTSSGGGASGAATGGGSGGASGSASGAASGSASAATGAATGGSSVMTVADLDSLEVDAQVPELDVGRVNPGLPATVAVNALPGEDITGSVSSVDVMPGAATGAGTSSTVQYGTTIGVAAPPRGLRPGMSASVSIVVATASDTTFLPSVAVTPIGGAGATAATVQVLGRDQQVTTRTVGIGLTSDTTTQITSGLAPGELAVLPDAAAVDPNQFRGGPRTQQQGTGR